MTSEVLDPRAVGPAVATSVVMPGLDSVTFLAADHDESISLTPAEAVRLFAVGLATPEPDRTGWITIAELVVDDAVKFLIGATPVNLDFAMEAVRRGVETAITDAVIRDRGGQSTSRREGVDR